MNRVYTDETLRRLVSWAYDHAQYGPYGSLAVLQGGLAPDSGTYRPGEVSERLARAFETRGVIGDWNFQFGKHAKIGPNAGDQAGAEDTICAERGVIKSAVQVQQLDGSTVKRPIEAFVTAPGPQYLFSKEYNGSAYTFSPCHICFHAMIQEQSVTPDTLIIAPRRTKVGEDRYDIDIVVRPLKYYFPRMEQQANYSAVDGDKAIDSLHVAMDWPGSQTGNEKKARALIDAVFQRQGTTIQQEARTLLGLAQEAFLQAENQKLSKRGWGESAKDLAAGSAVVFYSPNTDKLYRSRGTSFHITDRSFVSAEVAALHNGLEEPQGGGRYEKVPLMVAYYSSKDNRFPNPYQLNDMFKVAGANKRLLVATIEDNRIMVRPLAAYQTEFLEKPKDHYFKLEPDGRIVLIDQRIRHA